MAGQFNDFIEVELDAQGEADIVVFSTGGFTDAYVAQHGGEAALARYTIEATDLGSDRAQPDEQEPQAGARTGATCGSIATADVVLTTKGAFGQMVDFTAKFLCGVVTGEGEGAAYVVSDIALSTIPITGILFDGRDLIKELVKGVRGGEPNYATLAFALAGLASEFPLLAPVNPVFAVGKALSKVLEPAGVLIKSVSRHLMDGVRDVVYRADFERLRRFAGACTFGGGANVSESGALAANRSAAGRCGFGDHLTNNPAFRDRMERAFKKDATAAADDQDYSLFPGIEDFYARIELITDGDSDKVVDLIMRLNDETRILTETINPRNIPSIEQRTRALIESVNGLGEDQLDVLYRRGNLDQLATGIFVSGWGKKQVRLYVDQVEEALVAGRQDFVDRFHRHLEADNTQSLLDISDSDATRGIASMGAQNELIAADMLFAEGRVVRAGRPHAN